MRMLLGRIIYSKFFVPYEVWYSLNLKAEYSTTAHLRRSEGADPQERSRSVQQYEYVCFR